MASLGQELKRERELRGISLQEISASTRISQKFLQALEEDELDIIPGEFFVRAILRSYAKSIGIDENQVLNRYREIRDSSGYESNSEVPRKSNFRVEHRWRKWPLLFGFLFTILAAGLISVLVLAPKSHQEIPLRPDREPSSLLVTSPPVEAPKPEEKTYEGLNLELSFLEETWLKVSADGTVSWDGIKKKGESLQIRGVGEIELSLGNAGGFIFTINGKKGKPFGPMGAVRKDIRITLGNYNEFVLPEEERRD